MTWSYSGDPASSDLDEVRFWLQDTDTTDQLMTDEEIQFVIDSNVAAFNSNIYAASVCAETVAARFTREIAVAADGVSASVEQLQQKYNDLAASLRDQYRTRMGIPSAGGIEYGEYPDTTIKPLSFGKGMHDNVNAGRQDYGGAAQQFPDYPEDALP